MGKHLYPNTNSSIFQATSAIKSTIAQIFYLIAIKYKYYS